MMRRAPLKPSSKPLARRTPMKRSGFKRPTPAAGISAPRRAAPMKRSRPRVTKIRASARGEACTIRLEGVCLGTTETTVWCHSNRSEDGKGMGLKAQDHRGAYGCYACHMIYDRQWPLPKGMTREYVEDRFTIGMALSAAILKAKGLWPEAA